MEERVYKAVLDSIAQTGFVGIDPNDDNMFEYSIDDNKRMTASEMTMLIAEGKWAEDAFNEHIINLYKPIEKSIIDDVVTDIGDNFKDIDIDLLRKIVDSHIDFVLPVEKLKKQRIMTEIKIDTGDSFEEFTLCNGFENGNVEEKSPLLWLGTAQGYEKREIEQAIFNEEYNNSIFLKSLVTEIRKKKTTNNILTFRLPMSVEDLLDAVARKNSIKIPFSGECGIASIGKNNEQLGIVLEEDMTVPYTIIYGISFED